MGLLHRIDQYLMNAAEEAKAERAAKAKEEYKPFQSHVPEYSFNDDERLENTAPHLVATIYETRKNTREIKSEIEQLSSKYDELAKHYIELKSLLQGLSGQKTNLTESNTVS